MDKTLSKSEAFFGADNVKAPEPKLGNKPILGDRYKSKEFMNLEWEKMFTKVWQVAGLEQQLENPGDFFTFDFGPESIICAKGEDNKIRCFYNVCQHRGNQLVQVEEGNLESFSCAYHAWKFGLDGFPDVSHIYRTNQDSEFLFDTMIKLNELGFNVHWQFIIFSFNVLFPKSDSKRSLKILYTS